MYGLLYECKFLTIEETNKKKSYYVIIKIVINCVQFNLFIANFITVEDILSRICPYMSDRLYVIIWMHSTTDIVILITFNYHAEL